MGPVLDSIAQEKVRRLLSIAQESVFSGHTGWTCSPQELADFLRGFY